MNNKAVGNIVFADEDFIKGIPSLLNLMIEREKGGEVGARGLWNTVPWFFAGTQKRARAGASTPFTYLLNEEEIEHEPRVNGADIDTMRIFWQGINSFILNGAAYYLAVWSSGQLLEVRFLDPLSIKLMRNTTGVHTIVRNLGDNVKQKFVRRTNGRYIHKPTNRVTLQLVPVWFVGMQEIGVGAIAGEVAASDATYLQAYSATMSMMLDKGVMPTTLVFSKHLPKDEQKRQRVTDWLRRMLTTPEKAGDVEVLQDGVYTFEQIKSQIGDMEQSDTYNDFIDSVLAALETPRQIIDGSSANRATLELLQVEWYLSVVFTDVMLIVQQLNRWLFDSIGMKLMLHPEKHHIMQVLQEKRVNNFSILVSSGLSPDIAAQVVGLDIGNTESPAPPDDDPDGDMVAEEMRRLRRFIESGKHKKRPFKSDILTPQQIESEVAKSQGAPFRKWSNY